MEYGRFSYIGHNTIKINVYDIATITFYYSIGVLRFTNDFEKVIVWYRKYCWTLEILVISKQRSKPGCKCISVGYIKGDCGRNSFCLRRLVMS